MIVKERKIGRQEANEKEQKRIDRYVAVAAQKAASLRILEGNYTVIKRRDDSREIAQWFVVHRIDEIPQGAKTVAEDRSKMLLVDPEQQRELFALNSGKISSVLEVRKTGVSLKMFILAKGGNPLSEIILGQILNERLCEALKERKADEHQAQEMMAIAATNCMKGGHVGPKLLLFMDHAVQYGIRLRLLEDAEPLPEGLHEKFRAASDEKGRTDIYMTEDEYTALVESRKSRQDNVVAELFIKDSEYTLIAEGSRGRCFMQLMMEELERQKQP